MSTLFFIFHLAVSLLFTPIEHPVKPLPLPCIPYIPIMDQPMMISADGGNQWKDFSRSLPTGVGIYWFSAQNDHYLIGTNEGIFKADPVYPIPQWDKEPFTEKEVSGCFPGKEGIYVTSWRKGFYQIDPQSPGWKKMDQQLPEKEIFDILESETDALVVSTVTGIYRSADEGKSWRHSLDASYVHEVKQSNGIMMACGEKGVFRSTDDGLTWKRLHLEAENYISVSFLRDRWLLLVNGPDVGFVESPNTFYESKDYGVTWNPASFNTPANPGSFHSLGSCGDNWFISGAEGLFRSTDQGKTWNCVLKLPRNKSGSIELTNDGHHVYALYREGC